jgi:two-component system response regulator ChvI
MASPFGKWAEGLCLVFVEDDEEYREALSYDLSDLGFSVRGFSDGAELLEALEIIDGVDLILLDWNLPQMPGIDLLDELRRRGIELPVVFLTGYGASEHEEAALSKGAVDFIDKTRGAEVLARRLKALLRKRAADSQVHEAFGFGHLVLRPHTGRAYWNQIDVDLTYMEYAVVDLLVRQVGQVVSYRAIYDVMHYHDFIAGHGEHGYRVNVRTAIKRIRQKFRLCAPQFDEITNFSGQGYSWRLHAPRERS